MFTKATNPESPKSIKRIENAEPSKRFRLMKPILADIIKFGSIFGGVLLLGALFHTTGYAQKKRPVGKAKLVVRQDRVSPAFKEKAIRAVDAIERMGVVHSSDSYETGYDSYETGYEQRKLDVEKAIAEAKYKATTDKDFDLLNILQITDQLVGWAKERKTEHEDWKMIVKVAGDCRNEVQFEIDLELSKFKRERTCLKQRDAILQKWNEQLR